jgi:hypothetical protein
MPIVLHITSHPAETVAQRTSAIGLKRMRTHRSEISTGSGENRVNLNLRELHTSILRLRQTAGADWS